MFRMILAEDRFLMKKKIFWVFVVMILVGMTGFAYRFIQQASQSAAGIHSNVPTQAPLPEPASGLYPDTSLFNTFSSMPYDNHFASPSTGKDVLISAGEFSYDNGKPSIRLAIKNQSSFVVSSVYVSVALYLNNSNAPVATQIGIPIAIENGLMREDETVINVPVEGVSWHSADVLNAQKRRMMAQIVAVGDTSNGSTDYPQTTSAVWLHTLNQQVAEPLATERVETENAPNDAAASAGLLPSSEDNAMPWREDLPTGEARILHYEEKSYQR